MVSLPSINPKLKRLFRPVTEATYPNLREFWASRQPIIWLIALAIGLFVGLGAAGFRGLISSVQLLWLMDMSERVAAAARKLEWYWVVISPAAGGLFVGLVLHYFMPQSRIYGVPDVIEAKALGLGRLTLKTGLLSTLLSGVSLGAGGSAGREGPVVYFGATIAAVIARKFEFGASVGRTLLGCGVAAAISASFNAPIAGVLFAHEVILGHYALSAFVPIVLASVVGAVISQLIFGDVTAFNIPDYDIISYLEFPAFALLGIVCAAVAIIFQFSIIFSDRAARSVNLPIWARPAIGGLIVGLIGTQLPEVLGVGYDATDAALKGNLPLSFLLLLLVAKTAATSITIASRFGGGMFSPALYLGAVAGSAYGLVAGAVFPDLASSPGLYAVLGMGAVAGAVLGAPISTIMIAFELTSGYALSLALLLTVSIASALHLAVHGRSIFHWQLKARGIMLEGGPHRHVARTIPVSRFMRGLAGAHPEPLPEGDTLPHVNTGSTLEHVLRAFDQDDALNRLPVVAHRGDGEVVIGWVHKADALRAFNKALVDLSIEEHK